MITSWRSGPIAPWNPWRGRTLEWLVSSPPSLFNFEATPQVVGGPYQYGVPGARHAVVFAPEEIGGELTETEKRTILVIANQTVASSTLIDEIRRRAHEGLWRFTIAVPTGGGDRRGRRAAAAGRPSRCSPRPASTPAASWSRATRSTPSRPCSGTRSVHEVMLATYPTGSSAWMADDMLDRLRKSTGLGVTRVVVRPEEAREPLARAGVTQVAVIADEALGGRGPGRRRCTSGPTAARSASVLLAPMALEGPGWTDEAEALRVGHRRAGPRGHRRASRRPGSRPAGEVLDGDAAAAARVAREAYRAEAILIVATRGSRLDSDETLAAVQAAAGGATVERVVVDAEAPTSPAGS